MFRNVTKAVSGSSLPLLHVVIPYIDSLTKKLERVINNASKPAIVRAAAARSLAVLNKYYAKTDQSIMYRMSMRKLLVLPINSTTLIH
jgi:hypothetical protein